MRKLYRPLYLNETPIISTDIQTAEVIKYASNSFLATKIGFINQVADLCEVVGANVQDVAKAMGIDKRIGSDAPNNFTWHFKKRPKLRKALKAITGKAKSFVTYEDYKLALDIKAKLELEGADEYFEETKD